MKNKAKFITVFLFCAACFGFLPDISHATSDAQPISIKDKHGTEVSIYNESHALVIGGSDYTGGWPKLPGVEKDILLVNCLLKMPWKKRVLMLSWCKTLTARGLKMPLRDLLKNMVISRTTGCSFILPGMAIPLNPNMAVNH
jgi:hypothetical protein